MELGLTWNRAKTSIPVPEVHSYSLDLTNDVGAPYILMDYIHGTVATELREARKCNAGLFGTPNQDRKFRQQMADIQVKLSSFTFDQIGSLYQDEQTSDFFIGPDIETGKGPWASSTDYYTDLANHVLQACVRSAEPRSRPVSRLQSRVSSNTSFCYTGAILWEVFSAS